VIQNALAPFGERLQLLADGLKIYPMVAMVTWKMVGLRSSKSSDKPEILAYAFEASPSLMRRFSIHV